MEKIQKTLQEGITTLGITVPDSFTPKIQEFIALLIKWNKSYNLTAITDPSDIVTRHILDSLTILPYIQGDSILDIGSGAGFPGIPCALALPDKQFVLLDSNGKKTRFLTQAILELALPNITVVQSRVEKYRPTKCFDTITARAFSSLETILNQTAQVLCPEGELLVMKGIYPSLELQNIKERTNVIALHVPGLDEQRHLVCIKKGIL
jgi:16S rRNA (guanine527-N7)-methyltransferase